MSSEKRPKVPACMSRLEKRLTAWRKTRKPGQRIPASIWKSAAKLAAEYGLSRTAVTLKLSYTDLRKYVEETAADSQSNSPFIELPSSTFPLANECKIEWEDGDGAIMRMHLKGSQIPDALALGKSFWRTEG